MYFCKQATNNSRSSIQISSAQFKPNNQSVAKNENKLNKMAMKLDISPAQNIQTEQLDIKQETLLLYQRLEKNISIRDYWES